MDQNKQVHGLFCFISEFCGLATYTPMCVCACVQKQMQHNVELSLTMKMVNRYVA